MVQSRLDIVQRCCSGDPYHNLANAIIVMAADDYIRAIKSKDILRQREIESFFYSDSVSYTHLGELSENH